MNITEEQLHRQVKTLSPTVVESLRRAAKAATFVDLALLLGVGSRETNLKNIIGDGGHGRGMFQIDDRSHGPYLRRVAKIIGTDRIAEDAKYATALLETNVRQAIAAGVPIGHRFAVAISGYNAGMGRAIADWKEHHNSDRNTTGGDYSADVRDRARTIRKHNWIGA